MPLDAEDCVRNTTVTSRHLEPGVLSEARGVKDFSKALYCLLDSQSFTRNPHSYCYTASFVLTQVLLFTQASATYSQLVLKSRERQGCRHYTAHRDAATLRPQRHVEVESGAHMLIETETTG